MRARTKSVVAWGPRSASWRLTALAGTGLVALGIYGLSRPKVAATTFGMPIQDQDDITTWRPKAARDLATGVLTLNFLAFGNKRALGAYAVGATLIPAFDALLVATSDSGKPWQIVMHGGTAGLVLAIGVALLRGDG